MLHVVWQQNPILFQCCLRVYTAEWLVCALAVTCSQSLYSQVCHMNPTLSPTVAAWFNGTSKKAVGCIARISTLGRWRGTSGDNVRHAKARLPKAWRKCCHAEASKVFGYITPLQPPTRQHILNLLTLHLLEVFSVFILGTFCAYAEQQHKGVDGYNTKCDKRSLVSPFHMESRFMGSARKKYCASTLSIPSQHYSLS